MQDFAPRYRAFVLPILGFVLVALGVWVLVPFLPALLGAIVLSVLLYPLHARLKRRMPEGGAAILTTLLAIVLILIPIGIAGLVLYAQAANVIAELERSQPSGQGHLTVDSLVTMADTNLAPVLKNLGVSNFSVSAWFSENRRTIAENLARTGGRYALQSATSVISVVIALLTMFFLLRDGHRLRRPALELIPLPKDQGERILERLGDTIRAVFVGVVLVGLVQGSLAGLAYWVAGVQNPFVWFVATTVLCMVPLLGSPIVYIPLSLALIGSGKLWNGVGLLLFGLLVVSQIDNVLRPFIIGMRVSLHPMAIFFALLGGLLAFGPVGIMAGPMLLTALLALQDVVRTRLSNERESESSVDPS
ncbi:MAG: AI-2E family transporter [Fimbriimonadaceae bacterium]|nr:AI-2E family transporter [Fimbriimonadaceae bacterium]